MKKAITHIRFRQLLIKSILLLILVLPYLGVAQGELKGEFINYKAKDGLLPESVNIIEQDDIGRIWLGTDDGLYHFDGNQFGIELIDYQRKAIRALRVNDLVTVKNQLWIATDNGLFLKQEMEVTQTFSLEDDLNHQNITDLYLDRHQNYLYVGVLSEDEKTTLLKINTQNLAYQVFHRLDSLNGIYAMYQKDSTSAIWLGGNDLYQFEATSEQLYKVTLPATVKYDYENGRFVQDIDWYQNKLLISTDGQGIFEYDMQQKQWLRQLRYKKRVLIRERLGSIQKLVPKNDTTFFVATHDNGFGVFYVPSGTFAFYKNDPKNRRSIPFSRCQNVFVDRNENIWIGMQSALSFYTEKMRLMRTITLNKEEMGDDGIVTDIATSKDGKTIVLGVLRDGFVYLDENLNRIERSFETDEILQGRGGRNLVHGTQNNIFSSTRSYLQEMNLNDSTLRVIVDLDTIKMPSPYKPRFNSTRPAPDGKIWATTRNNAVYVYDDRTLKGELIQLEPVDTQNFVYEVAFTPNTAWVNAQLGFYKIENQKTTKIQFENYPSDERIITVAALNDSIVMLGMSRSGLLKYNLHTNLVEQLTKADGVINNNIEELEMDKKGNIWGVTSQGLFAYLPNTNRAVFFSSVDGMTQNFVNNYYIDSLPDGRMSFSGNGQLVVFDPDALLAHQLPKSPVITAINGQYFAQTPTEMTLEAAQPFLNLYFTHFEYAPTSIDEYSYRLLPQQKEWKKAPKDGNLSFPQLAVGHYTLELKTQNRFGEYSAVTQLKIFVKTVFWKTWWFIGLLALIIGGLIAAFTRYTVQRQAKEKALKERYETELQEMELKALRAYMNPHFLFNSLNSIRLFIQKSDNRAANSYISKFSQLLRFILNHSNVKTVTLAEELKALKLYLEFESLRFEDKFVYSIDVDDNIRTNKIHIQPLILQPFIENAIWHGIMNADESGTVSIHVYSKNNIIHIDITDDGIGINLEELRQKQQGRMGLNLVQKRIALFNAKSDLNIQYQFSNLTPLHPTRKGTKVAIKIEQK